MQRRNSMSDTEGQGAESVQTPLADILDRSARAPERDQGGQPQATEQAPAATETGEGQETERAAPAAEPPKAAPPAAETEPPHVPIAALKDERTKRQEAERRLAELETRLAQGTPQRPATLPNPAEDPAGYHRAMQDALLDERLNTSEMIARRDHADMDEKLAVFMEAAKADPSLGAKLATERHPWDWVYHEAKRIQARQEIGDDPAAFRQRVEAEIRAKIAAEGHPPASSPPAASTPLPTSLASARAVGARATPPPAGPTPIDQIVRFKG